MPPKGQPAFQAGPTNRYSALFLKMVGSQGLEPCRPEGTRFTVGPDSTYSLPPQKRKPPELGSLEGEGAADAYRSYEQFSTPPARELDDEVYEL